MKLVHLGSVRYVGGDIVPQLIAENHEKYASKTRSFVQLDLMRDPLPPADVLLCRDCFIHLSFHDLKIALRNIAKSNITYILTTTYPKVTVNTDIVTRDFRGINLQLPLFDFPEPLERIDEDLFPGHHENPNFIRQLGLWRVSELRQ